MATRKILTAGIALLGLIVVLVWVKGGFHSKVPGGTVSLPAEKTGSLKTAKAEISRSAGAVTVSGTVASRDTALISSRILGYVVELKVDAGSRVKKGDLLLRIDSKELAERERQASAGLDSAKADLVKYKTDFERYKVLFEKESVAKKDYDDALARYEIARAAEQRAQAAVDEASTMLSYGRVTAPFDGIVAERSVNVGDLATPGKPLLSVYTPSSLELVAAVGEQYAAFLKEGDPVKLAVPSIGVAQDSKIREVVPLRDVKTRTITVKAPLAGAPGLGPGLYGTMTFTTRTTEVIVVPKTAVHVVGQLETVKVLEKGTVRIRNVKTGRWLPDGRVEILSGLEPGEEVVVD